MSEDKRKTLPVLLIELEHGGGVENFDHNSIIWLFLQRGDDVLSWKPVTGRVSDLSGKPAILYRAHDYEICLTQDEMLRYIGKDLKPEEYRKLRDKHGDHFEIHDDFYDPDTGEALQPIGER